MDTPDAALLGAVLSGYGDYETLAETVRAPMFYSPHDEVIWDAMGRVRKDGQKIDPISVKAKLDDRQLAEAGGPIYLTDLMESCPNVLDAPFYAQQVIDGYTRRQLSNACRAVHEDVQNTTRPIEAIVDRARSLIDDATLSYVGHQPVQMASVMADVVDVAEKGRAIGLSTPWPDIDNLIGGLAPGRVIVIGARPGVGKSIMGTNLALDVALRHGHGVVLCSMEMPRTEVGQRMLAAHARVSLSALEHGKLPPRTLDAISGKINDLCGIPVTVEDSAMQTVSSIRGVVRNAIKNSDATIAVVIVDYLQLMTPSDSRVNRVEQVGEMSRGLKQIAREYGVCVVAMAQVNRASTMRKDGRPTMADLRESGSIEADADIVILLHRPDSEGDAVEAIVEKNRSGPKGTALLELRGHYALLETSPWSTGSAA